MAGLVPAIHVFFLAVSRSKTWMPGTRPGMTEQNIPGCSLEVPSSVLYDIHHFISDRSRHDRPDRLDDRDRPAPRNLLDLPASSGARGAGGDGNAGHQYPAAVAAADGDVAACLDRRCDVLDHGIPRGVRGRTTPRRADLGSLWPALAGADGLCGVLRRQHLV